jgi:hypothetical protein
MSGFELIYLFNEHVALLLTEVNIYLTMLFAFIVASFLAAKRMTPAMSHVAIGLFTGAGFVIGYAINRTSSDIVDLAGQIRQIAQQEGSVLAFHNFSDEPAFLIGSTPWLLTILMVIAYAASIFFFFHARAAGEDLSAT